MLFMMFKPWMIIVCTGIAFLGSMKARAQMHYESSVSVSGGLYAASGFGTNPYFAARYNYFLMGGKFFVEGSIGFSSLKSHILETVSKSQIFESERLFSYEFVVALDANPQGYYPFVVFGVAAVNQGGQSTFAGVLGLGKRIPLPGVLGNQLGLRYDVRDQIFSQQINNNESFISHNVVVSIGLQLYF
jgi:hypothetical protein